jgi:hypothetical protein
MTELDQVLEDAVAEIAVIVCVGKMSDGKFAATFEKILDDDDFGEIDHGHVAAAFRTIADMFEAQAIAEATDALAPSVVAEA